MYPQLDFSTLAASLMLELLLVLGWLNEHDNVLNAALIAAESTK